MTKIKPLLNVIALLSAGVWAILWAVEFMGSLTSYRSPLRSQPPSPGPPLGERLTRRVVFVLVDALRLDTALDADVMPHLAMLRRLGGFARMHSRPPSYSEPGYTVLLTGAWPDISDGPPINLPYEDIYPFTQDNLFSAAHRNGMSSAVSGYYWFEALIPQETVQASFYTSGEDKEADGNVVEAAFPWLKEANSYQLILIHIDQVDYAGHHEGGPLDVRWNEAAGRADELIEQIGATLDYSQDTLLVASDHGQIDRGGHGGNEQVTLTEPFLLVGVGVKAGDYGDVDMVDVAPTVSALLGINLPASSQGRVLMDMLDLKPAHAQDINAAWIKQQDLLLTAYQREIGNPWIATRLNYSSITAQNAIEKLRSIRLVVERLPRVIFVMIYAIITMFLIYKLRSRATLWTFAGALIYLALFHIGYAIIGGKTYSLSSVDSAGGLLASIGIGSVLPILFGWLVAATGNRIAKLTPWRAFENVLSFTWLTIYLQLWPVLWCYALNGYRVTWTLPEFTSAFVGFISLLQIPVAVLLGLTLSSSTGIVLWFAQSIRNLKK